MSTYDPVQETFDRIIQEFKTKLNNDEVYAEILKAKSIEDVYATTDKLQQEQAKSGHLRHLAKIEPFLDRLRDYAGAIEILIQAKSNILALIWGPIKLLLQWSYVLKRSFDAVVDTTAEIGKLLPEFARISKIFDKSDTLKDLLALFFQDILDFYLVILQFFSKSRWQIMFEAMWPRQRGKIELVVSRIERHKLLMRSEVRLEHIQEEYDARIRTLAHFETTEKAILRDEHDSIKTSVSPVFYDTQLYRYRSATCIGTNMWLNRDAKYIQWRAPDDYSTRVIWLQGIPGSGKTMLAASVVYDAQNSGPPAARTIFGFLSHNHASSTTALSVMHSLIFQLTTDDPDLRVILCQCIRANLKNDLDVTTSVLSSLLSSAGPVFIILDGLDEIDRPERQNLVKTLIGLTSSCSEVKLMLSSRNEVDIARTIGDKSKIIRVNDRNSGSIQAFVSHKSREWLQTRDFDPDEIADVGALLAPVAANAQGMFLYAKIVLTYIEPLYDIDAIRNELKVLPKDLHDAYARILMRINKHPAAAARDDARRVLGWIGCSPAPLTVKEIEQALAIRLDEEFMRRVRAPTNIIELCGPIIEITDGYAQFVHFTAKEYLFASSIDGSIEMRDAALSLTKQCIWFLCQNHYQDCLSAERVKVNLIDGRYRLHYYAINNWMKLVMLCIALVPSESIPDDLIDLLQTLAESRLNHNLGKLLDAAEQGVESKLSFFRDKWPAIYSMLRHEIEFERQVSNQDSHLLRIESWGLPAPLTIMHTAKVIHLQWDSLLCKTSNHVNGCVCTRVQYHYGTRLFKCGFLACSFFCWGFNEQSTRSLHEAHHERSWKCDDPSCEYGVVGFLSRRMRDEHLLSHNTTEQQPADPSAHLFADLSGEDLDKDELQAMLFDLIRLDKARNVRALLPHMNRLFNDNEKLTVAHFAASSGSAAMTRMLCNEFSGLLEKHLPSIAISAIRARNLETSSLLSTMVLSDSSPYSRTTYAFYNDLDPICVIINAVIESDDLEFYDMARTLVYKVLDMTSNTENAQTLAACFYSASSIKASRVSEKAERWLSSMWLLIHTQHSAVDMHKKNEVTNVLHDVAAYNPSIILARTLLSCGVSVQSRAEKKRSTALHWAVKKSSEKNARLAEFMLYHDADPDPKVETLAMVSVSEARCAKEMSKWLGVSWDDLVARVQADRARGYCPPEYRLDVED